MASPSFYSNWPTFHQRHHTATVPPPPELSPFNDHFTLTDTCIDNASFNNGFNNNNVHFHYPISYPTLSSSYNPLAAQQQLVPASLPDVTQSFGFGHEYYSNAIGSDVCDDGGFFFMDPVEPMQLCSQPDYYPYPSYPIVQDVCPMEEMQPELLRPLPEIYDGGGSSTAVPSPVRGNLYSGVGFNATQEEERSVQMKENGDGRGRISAQSMAARVRRRKISEKTSELGKLVPGGHRMTTAEMFQAAFKYIKFLQAQVGVLEQMPTSPGLGLELQALLTCPTIQEKLYVAGKCIVSQTLGETLADDHQRTTN